MIVADIFHRVAVKGDSIRGVARYLNRAGALPPSIGKRVYKDGRTPRWGKSTVTRILREPAYKGLAIAWRWQTIKVAGRQTIVLRPESDHIRLPEGTVPEIVSAELWQKAQPIDGLGANKRNEQREYLLRGRIVCEKCGNAMYTQFSKGKRWYRCSSKDKAMGRCGAQATPADLAEQFVWAKLMESIQKPHIIVEGMKSLSNKSQLTKLDKEQRDIESALAASLGGVQKILRRFRAVESEVLLQALDAEVKLAEQEQARLRTRLAEVADRKRAAEGVMLDFAKLRDYCKRIAVRLANAEFSRKALALRAWNGRVIAEGKRVTFHMDLSEYVAGETATSYSNYSQNSHLIHTFKNEYARAA